MTDKSMRAARLHSFDSAFQVDTVPRPNVRDLDVLVEVKAVGLVPNLVNVLSHWREWFPDLPQPELPAIFGLDSSGIVGAVGERVRNDIKVGDRVYVNPGLSCGTCPACRAGDDTNCVAYTFMGYFGFGPGSRQIYQDYPYGGFGEYLVAPAANVVKLPSSVSFEQAARFGYTGTAFSALRKANFEAGQTVLVDGATGTLGVGGVICALAMGAARIFATGRNKALLAKLQAIDPHRIRTLVSGEESIAETVRNETGGYGVDVVLQALGANAPATSVAASIDALRSGGMCVFAGGVVEPVPIDSVDLMCNQKSIVGSRWFTTAQGQRMADLAGAGLLNLGVYEHERFSVDTVGEAIEALRTRVGGFINVVVVH